ncbi:MAG: hypothetical protein ACUVUG_04485 [Candidatus Aminicenantia bacterium]
MTRSLDNDFFNAFVYSIFRAIGEKLGEESWTIVWRTGEIFSEELKEKLFPKRVETSEVAKMIAKYLRKAGYLKNAKIKPLSENEFEYWMKTPVIENCAFRLINEGFVPPHISTSILFAFFKKILNVKLELVGNPQDKKGWIVERWKIIA